MDDDTRWIRRYCADADEAAFQRFYRAHAERLWRFLVARGADPDHAYDLLSETFLRFIQRVCRDPRSPKALLYRIAVNLHIDARRRHDNARVERRGLDPTPGHGTDPGHEERETVRALLATLPVDEQNLLLMRYWIGLTHREIAQVTDMPDGTVRRLVAAALEKLRRQWREGAQAADG